MRCIILIQTLVFLVLLSSCQKLENTPRELTFETVTTKTGSLESAIELTGAVKPTVEILVGSEASGRVNELFVDFNSVVSAGDVLATIDSTNIKSQIRRLNDQILSAEVNRKIQLVSIERAQTILENAKIRLEREKDLYDQNATSLAVLEAVQREFDLAVADLKLAEIRLASRDSSINQLNAQLDEAKTNLSHTVIKSPIDGIVADKRIEVGQTVQSNFNSPELFVITSDLSQIFIESEIPESEISNVNVGDLARFTIEAFPERFFTGKVKNIRIQPQEKNGLVTYTTIVEAQNPYADLRTGMTVNLQIIAFSKTDLTLISTDADRFSPSPDMFNSQGDSKVEYDYVKIMSEPISDIFDEMGFNPERRSLFIKKLTEKSKTDNDIVGDVTRLFEHQPAKYRIHQNLNRLLKTTLEETELIEFNSHFAEYKKTRQTDFWINGEGEKIERRSVRLGVSNGDYVEVISGLSESDKVITGISP